MINLALEDIVVPYCETCEWEPYYQKVKLCDSCAKKPTLTGLEIKELYDKFRNTNGGQLYGEKINCIILSECCYENVDDDKYYKLITLVGLDGGYMVFPFEVVKNTNWLIRASRSKTNE